MLSPPSKRSKSFTGCFTCRLRKIRCDLTRPGCKNCNKSGLACSGYDIKLKWSKPLTFRATKRGYLVPLQVSFKDEDGDENSEHFQRRKVGAVTWKRPYLTYDEMDRDLMILHNLSKDNMVSKEDNTKLLGPFGVFQLRKTEKKNDTNVDTTHQAKPFNEDPYVSKDEIKDDKYKDMKFGKDEMKFGKAFTPSYMSPYVALPYAEPQADQVWLSNELRDDALLTAAALNGDSQFLEFMNRYSQMLPTLDTPKQADLLNLVFHRNHSEPNVGEEISPGVAANMVANSGNGTPASSSQSALYSNYNNYFYNNPYHLNELLEIHLHAATGDDELTDLVDGHHATQMPELVMRIVQTPLHVGFDLSASGRFSVPSSALQVQPLTRYLLNYYVSEVADLMTVIPLTENPWKTIYFPRALMAIGELAALGTTSPAKNALLNALLAVSAFNLQLKFPKNSDAMRYYLNLGIRLRNQASLFVKQLLHSRLDRLGVEHCVRSEKYKDVLCAVMLMISVDLVWGTMQDTNFYITWCGKVIAAKMKTKLKLTLKARVLHRIFLSMKLIQDLTCLDIEHVRTDFESSIIDVNFDTGIGYGRWVRENEVNSTKDTVFDSKGQKNRIAYIVNATLTLPTFVNKKLINTKKDEEHFATDALYGLPNSLIVLFWETVQLLRTKIHHQEDYHKLPDDFTKRVNELNRRLLNWKLDWNLYESNGTPEKSVEIEVDPDIAGTSTEDDTPKKFYSAMHETTYHHTYSFYHALMIYFNRLIKEIPPERLQIKVARTLKHLNAIQRLILEGDAAIIPLFWQGFIAGCEATLEELQQGFKSWGADIAQYLGSYWGARQIMLEVWRRKRMNEARDDWVSVIRDWEMNLMLN